MSASSFKFMTALLSLQQLSPYSSLRDCLIFSLCFMDNKLNSSPIEVGGKNSTKAGLGLVPSQAYPAMGN